MKTRKSTILLLLVTTLVGFASSCKKGKDDPTLSLRSRKARMEGEWKVSTYTINGQNMLGQGESIEITFKKDGTGEFTEKDGSNVDITKITWSFLSKSGDYKNKERLSWVEDGDIDNIIFDITELKNDKIKLFRETKSGSNVSKMELTLDPL